MQQPVRRTIRIDGMSCGHCVRAVTDALARVPGLRTLSVAVGHAVVEADLPAAVPRATAAIGDAGFEATVEPAESNTTGASS